MKRPMTRRTRLLISAIVGLSVALIVFTAARRAEELSVTFLAFTNHPSRGWSALFVLTNKIDRKLQFSVQLQELNSNGVWVPDFYKGVLVGGSELGQVSWGDLTPRGCRTAVVSIHPEGRGELLRAAAVYARPRKLDLWRYHLSANLDAIRNGRSLPLLKGTLYSPWDHAHASYSCEFINESHAPVILSSDEIR
jgi:hypothetical protein